MTAVRDGDVEIHDMWKPGDGSQTLHFFKRNVENVIRELLADIRLAGNQHLYITHIHALLSYVVGYINIDVGIDIYIDVSIDIDAVYCNLYLSWAGLRVLDCSFSIQ